MRKSDVDEVAGVAATRFMDTVLVTVLHSGVAHRPISVSITQEELRLATVVRVSVSLGGNVRLLPLRLDPLPLESSPLHSTPKSTHILVTAG